MRALLFQRPILFPRPWRRWVFGSPPPPSVMISVASLIANSCYTAADYTGHLASAKSQTCAQKAVSTGVTSGCKASSAARGEATRRVARLSTLRRKGGAKSIHRPPTGDNISKGRNLILDRRLARRLLHVAFIHGNSGRAVNLKPWHTVKKKFQLIGHNIFCS